MVKTDASNIQNAESRFITSQQELEEAIDTLQKFTSTCENDEIPTIETIQLEKGTLQKRDLSTLDKIVIFTNDMIEAFSTKKRKKQQERCREIQYKLLTSQDTIAICSRAILKWQQGNPIEQGLAAKLKQVVHNYNDIVNKTKKRPITIPQKLKHFFFNKAGWIIDSKDLHSIHLPATSEKNLPLRESYKISKETSSNKITPSFFIRSIQDDITNKQQEVELFKMKALTLLQKQLKCDVTEALSLLNQSQILIYPLESDSSSNKTFTEARATITIFPGEELEVSGVFERIDGKCSTLVQDSFQISLKVLQTGFPHPLQHNGFTFSEKLLPNTPLRPTLMPTISFLINQKRELAYDLSNKLRSNAKELFISKKRVFEKNTAELIPLMKRLILNIWNSFSQQYKVFCTQADGIIIIEKFFDGLSRRKSSIKPGFITNPMIDLSSVHSEVLTSFLDIPLESLHNELLFNQRGQDDISIYLENQNNELSKKIDDLLKIENNPFERQVLEYKKLLGTIFSKLLYPLGCLEISELLGHKPPTINEFEKKVLAATFLEFKSFYQEINEVSEEKILQNLILNLQRESLIFTDDTSDLSFSFVNELINYYQMRFSSS